MKQFQKEIKSGRFYYGLAAIALFFIFLSFFGIFGTYSSLMWLGILLIVIHLANHLYEKHVDNRLELINPRQIIRLYPEEESEFVFRLKQHGWLPILGGRLILTYDQIIEMDDMKKTTTGTIFEKRLNVLGREAIELRIPFRAVKRGVGRIRSVRLEVPYLFGYGKISLYLQGMYRTEFIVYPEITEFSLSNRLKPKKHGDYQSNFSIFENPTASYGTRSYLPGDPMNQIHWKATAKRQDMQTKVVERVSQLSWLILVNVREMNVPSFTGQIETILSHTAFLCRYATEKNIPYQVLINVPKRGSIPFYSLSSGSGKDHYAKTLETLARINSKGLTTDFNRSLQYAKSVASEHPYVFHLGVFQDDFLPGYQAIQDSGSTVSVLNHQFQKVGLVPLESYTEEVAE